MAKASTAGSFAGKQRVDRLRASLAGHAYHEAWAARSALELLPPKTTLTAIAIEGLGVEDNSSGGDAADEIADLVRYYGARSVANATRVEVVQFKYSIALATLPLRAADLAKTLHKFAETDVAFASAYGAAHVGEVVRYDFVTNRPIHPNLDAAVAAAISGDSVSGDIAKQVKQLTEAITQGGGSLSKILTRFSLSGSRGSLNDANRSVQSLLAAWGEAADPEAKTRLLQLRSLVRSKAGIEGEENNTIDRIAVIGEIVGVEHERELYPTEDAFPPVAHVIGRPITEDIIATSKSELLPLLVHAAGGMGKTVLMQSVAERLRETDHVVIFDGYGAGQWRTLEDGRHRPERTLVHLANLFAGQGLCDLLLPIVDPVSLMRAFKKRLAQAVETVRQASVDASVTLILDAIDHAGLAADATGSTSFARELMMSLAKDPIDGVKVIASCRTERISIAVADAPHVELSVPPFTLDEVAELSLARDPEASSADIAALKSRSGGNPRCLDALITAGRPYDGPSTPKDADPGKLLDVLLEKRIEAARQEALDRGGSVQQIDRLLAGIALLPPPVPIEELAASHGLDTASVESFVTDLSPLLERTPFGVMFRDEPTESLITNMVKADEASRNAIVAELTGRQNVSDYAARALPSVLTALQRTEELVTLAFDSRVPPGASKVSLRDIRLSRLTAALSACARAIRYDDVFRLLLEASIVAAGHERTDRFLYEYPDLAAISGDAEALRRLFAMHMGWPGGRHSALGVAYAFSEQLDEAERNAERALDWLRWEASTPRAYDRHQREISTELDEVGFAYVKFITGNDARVIRWLSSRPEQVAHAKFALLFDLLDRHSRTSPDIATKRVRLEKRLLRCRSINRGFWTAAAMQIQTDAPLARAVIDRLASIEPPEQAQQRLNQPLLHAAARGLSLGSRMSAQRIFETCRTRAQFHDFDSQWPVEDRPELAIVAAGIRAALKRRDATLLDIVPVELLAKVPLSLRQRGPKSFERELKSRLARAPKFRKPKAKTAERAKAEYDNREQYSRGLQHRIEPLVPFVSIVSRILAPRRGASPPEALTEGLAELAKAAASASNYPYADGKVFISRTAFGAIFEAGIAACAFDLATATQAVSILKASSYFYTPILIRYVEALSHFPHLQDPALELAAHVETCIARDTDTSSRIAAYGNLARAVWRISQGEARAYFRRALDLTDAIGSDEYDRTNDLFGLVGKYSGTPFSPSASHNLHRVFELNLYDARKYPWHEYGEAMARAAGSPALATIARLADRDVANLSQTLGPMLTALLGREQIPPEIAMCLFGLDRHDETWTWRLDTFATAVLPRLLATHRERLFQILLREIDRDDRLSPVEETIQGLRRLGEAHLAPDSPSLHRLKALAERVGVREPSNYSSEWQIDADEYAEFDTANPDEIERAIETCDLRQDGGQFPLRVLQGLASKTRTPDARIEFLRAVAATDGADLSTKLLALDGTVCQWSKKSAAVRDELPIIAAQLAAKHANELISASWESSSSWRRLRDAFGANPTTIGMLVIVTLSPSAVSIGGAAWLGLANKIASAVSSSAFKTALERFLDQAGANIPQDHGDGPLDSRMTVANDPSAIAASLIWGQLGNLIAASRWRAAHSLRALASANRFDVIDLVVAKFDNTSADAFSDAKLPFYYLHARLWLLIALARIARDHPIEMARHRVRLTAIATDASFPHVAMKAAAQRALRAIATALPPNEADGVLDIADTVNVPLPPKSTTKRRVRGMFQTRPKEHPRPDDNFHLDYDFNKYRVNDIHRTFECDEWEIHDGITRWVRSWDPNASSMYDCPRVTNGYQDGWSSSPPETDRYGGYLGWHALNLVAGEMLATRPLASDNWRSDPMAEFLKEFDLTRDDGLWLADATDLFPIDLRRFEMPEVDKKDIDPGDHAVLGPAIGLSPGERPAERIIVWGNWNAGGDVLANARSILIRQKFAKSAAYAALTDQRFSQWLPAEDDDDGPDDDYPNLPGGVLAWRQPEGYVHEGLDKRDPFAASTAAKRPRIPNWLITNYGLAPDHGVTRSWSSGSAWVAFSEAWGTKGGHGERSWEDDGSRLRLSWPFLQTVMNQEDKVLVGMVKARIYHRDRKDTDGSKGTFAHRVSAFILDNSGNVHFVSRIPRQAWDAVRSLREYDHLNFDKRFAAIRRALVK